MLSGCHITVSHCKHVKITLSNEDLQGRPPTRWRDQIQEDLGVPLQEAEHQAKEGLNGEGWLVGELRDTRPMHLSQVSQSHYKDNHWKLPSKDPG